MENAKAWRKERSHELILESAARLLRGRGIAETSVAEVIAAARPAGGSGGGGHRAALGRAQPGGRGGRDGGVRSPPARVPAGGAGTAGLTPRAAIRGAGGLAGEQRAGVARALGFFVAAKRDVGACGVPGAAGQHRDGLTLETGFLEADLGGQGGESVDQEDAALVGNHRAQ